MVGSNSENDTRLPEEKATDAQIILCNWQEERLWSFVVSLWSFVFSLWVLVFWFLKIFASGSWLLAGLGFLGYFNN